MQEADQGQLLTKKIQFSIEKCLIEVDEVILTNPLLLISEFQLFFLSLCDTNKAFSPTEKTTGKMTYKLNYSDSYVIVLQKITRNY